MKTFVKFCGLTEPTAIALAPQGGAAGFVIEVPASSRNLTIERAIELAGHVPAGAEAWAVVVDPTTELIHRIFNEVGVDRIQVHGKIPDGLDFQRSTISCLRCRFRSPPLRARCPSCPRLSRTRAYTWTRPADPSPGGVANAQIGRSVPPSSRGRRAGSSFSPGA